jgi:hypothetical protein
MSYEEEDTCHIRRRHVMLIFYLAACWRPSHMHPPPHMTHDMHLLLGSVLAASSLSLACRTKEEKNKKLQQQNEAWATHVSVGGAGGNQRREEGCCIRSPSPCSCASSAGVCPSVA